MNKPYISFVVAARNDNYGGNFLERMENFIENVIGLSGKYSLDTEIVIVEWNPPIGKEKLGKDLRRFHKPAYPQIRFIEVPNKIHQKFPNSDRMPIFEYIAKNVGIRRAKGEYIIATNPDILFSEELINFLSKRELSSNCFYRLDRYDVKKGITENVSYEKRLELCERYWFKRDTRYGTEYRINFDTFPTLDFSESLKFLRILISRLKEKSIFSDESVYDKKEEQMYTNASGDFFLMAKSQWHKLRGYPELPLHSHIDGFMCYMAKSLGLSQVIFGNNEIIYHQEHSRSQKHRPFTDYQYYIEKMKTMLRRGEYIIFNGEDWGLGNVRFKEYYL